MQLSLNKQTWLNLLLLVLAVMVMSPWKLGLDLSIATYISLPETYALICLLFIFYFRRVVDLNIKTTQIMLAVALLSQIGLYVVYLKARDQGLFAHYYANSNWSGTPEKSVSRKNPPLSTLDATQPVTRIDEQLSFSSRGFDLTTHVFPVFFLNDDARYGGEHVTEERLFAHKHFLFSSHYKGFIQIPQDTSLTLSIQAGEGFFAIDGRQCKTDTRCSIPVDSGIKPIEVSYQRLSTAPPILSLYWGGADTQQIVPSRAFRLSNTKNPIGVLLAVNSLLYSLALGLLIILLLALRWRYLWKAYKDELIVFVLCVLGSFYFLILCYQKGAALSTLIFSPGDWLNYETQARATLSGDWLNAVYSGGRPFFWNIGYRYLLAFLHYVFGENPLLIAFYQYLLLLAGLLISYKMIKYLFGMKAGVIFLVVLLLTNEIFSYPRDLLDTTFSILLPWFVVLSLIYFEKHARRRVLLIAGLLMAVAVVVRANFLPFLLLSSIWVYWVSPKNKRLTLITYLSLPCFLLSLIALRNWFVSGQITFMPASGPYNLWLAHRFNEFSDFAFTGIQVPDRSMLGKVAIDSIIHDPTGFVYRTYQKLLHILGFNITKAFRFNHNIFILNMAGLLSAAYLLLTRSNVKVVLLLLCWIGTVVASLLIIFPWGYGFRLQAPILLPLMLLMTLAINRFSLKMPAVCPKIFGFQIKS